MKEKAGMLGHYMYPIINIIIKVFLEKIMEILIKWLLRRVMEDYNQNIRFHQNSEGEGWRKFVHRKNIYIREKEETRLSSCIWRHGVSSLRDLVPRSIKIIDREEAGLAGLVEV